MFRMLTLGAMTGLLACSACQAGLDPLAPWPTANRDYRHTSRAPQVGPQRLQVLWSYQAEGPAYGPAVGADGSIYVPSDDTYLYALVPDGTLKWRFPLEGGPVSQHASIGDDGTIYATGLHLFAITPEGKEKWRFSADGLTRFQSPTPGPDGMIYQTATDGTLYAIDPATGKSRWSKKYGNDRIQAPISFGLDNLPYVSYRKGGTTNIFKVDLEGNILWDNEGADEMRSATIGDDGTAYLAVKTGTLIAYEPVNGDELWRREVRSAGATVTEFPAIGHDGTVYLGSGEGELGAYRNDGAVKWLFHPDDYLEDPQTHERLAVHMGTPVIDKNDTLYVPSPITDLWMINRDGKLLDRLELPELFTRMAMGPDGTIYTGSRSGNIYAIGVPKGEMTGDANADDKVNVLDATYALRMAVNLLPTTENDLKRLDVAPAPGAGRRYGDGKVNVGDVISILRYAVNPEPGWPGGPIEPLPAIPPPPPSEP